MRKIPLITALGTLLALTACASGSPLFCRSLR
ncbi:hypothetical protein AWB68_00679 [Caballeronia choica]|uniref:Lipoprotein n=1 Tax=Caballeronia choica TaxID=326476 RepID=A0A158FIL2_9BURK|nr:lipoprotein [Caballeronia choica]SAL19722.1 hypothetical protein AWB68_00679 [Caballeronia choica]